jgi:deoxyribonuclease V
MKVQPSHTILQLPHSWDISPQEAILIQKNLRQHIQIQPLKQEPRWIAGADVSFNRFSNLLFAGFVVLDLRDFKVVTRSSAVLETKFPYVPGLLTFREAPALLRAWEALTVDPDVVFFDGQGIAHPRGLGIASHMGLWINRPSIGCAKSILVGSYSSLALERGSETPLQFRGQTVGMVLRTKTNTSPVYVSVGHQIDLKTACRLVLQTVTRYRIPEPTRLAHLWVNEMRRSHFGTSAA